MGNDFRMNPAAWSDSPLVEIDSIVESAELALYNRTRTSRVSTLTHGERFTIKAQDGPWFLIQGKSDSYCGWAMPRMTLPPSPSVSAYQVTARATHIYPEPNFKTIPVMRLSMGARLFSEDMPEEEGFTSTQGGYVFSKHITPRDKAPWAYARDLLGVPYLWGGGTDLGIDCSGLAQLVYRICGKELLRDSDLQEGQCAEIPFKDRAPSDLIFWEGHVGILALGDSIIHATAWKMAVIEEDLAHAITRIGTPKMIGRVLD